MNETEFNLLDEPWIRVMDDNCQIKEVSLTDALLNAHKYKALKGEMPTQDIVILRLMLAIVHTVFSRVDADGNEAELEEEDDAVDRWESLWNNRKIPEKPMREYFEKWHERFWLFHPERPFGQMAGLTYGTEYGASKLNGEISESGNKTRIFSAYSGEQKSHLTYAQAARWLLYVNSFDDTSAKPTKEGKARAGGKLPSPGAGWLGKLGIVYLNGKNLFETLMLNLVLINNDNVESEEHPLWERDVPPTSERREIPYPTNLAELYTLQSRRMLLKREENYVIGYYLIGGDFFAKENAFVEPMTVWRTPSKASDPYNPKRHDSAKQMWREFSVLYDNADNKRPGFKFADYELKGVPVRLVMGGRDLENNTMEVMRRDTLEKETITCEGIEAYVQNLLEEIQANIYKKALDYRNSKITVVDTYEEFKEKIEEGGFILAHWDGTTETEEKIKEETKATIRCIPFESFVPGDKEPGKCMVTGKPSACRVIFARSY